MLKNIKISKKLILAFVIIAVFASIAGIYSTVTILNIDNQYSNALVNYGFSQGYVGKAMLNFASLELKMKDYLMFTDSSSRSSAKTDMDNTISNLNSMLQQIETTNTSAEETKIFNDIKSSFSAYEAKRQEVIKTVDSAGEYNEALMQKLSNELNPLFEAGYANFVALVDKNLEFGISTGDDLTRMSDTSFVIVVALVILSLLGSIILGIVISRSISKPMELCVKRINKLAEGDISSPVPMINQNDEVGMLSAATTSIANTLNTIISDAGNVLKNMAEGNFDISSGCEDRYVGEFSSMVKSLNHINNKLTDTLQSINRASDQVSSGAGQVSIAAQGLSQGATEQAAAVEELSATVIQISSQVKNNAQNAQEADSLSAKSQSEINLSNQQMTNMISAMNAISDSSHEIAKIVKTIDDIAFQTNILALNAAVEAARAGEAGKGFAVVADEVRNLAQKSAEAVKSTTKLIDDSVKSVENGMSIANNTAKSLEEVVTSSSRVSELVTEIAAACVQQSEAISQVTSGIDQISTVVQTNSATAEESAAASEELSSQAVVLKGMVAKFKLRKSGNLSSFDYSTSESSFTSDSSAFADIDDGGYSGNAFDTYSDSSLVDIEDKEYSSYDFTNAQSNRSDKY